MSGKIAEKPFADNKESFGYYLLRRKLRKSQLVDQNLLLIFENFAAVITLTP
jgi:hypothetical protein